jgi:hypothetical protein
VDPYQLLKHIFCALSIIAAFTFSGAGLLQSSNAQAKSKTCRRSIGRCVEHCGSTARVERAANVESSLKEVRPLLGQIAAKGDDLSQIEQTKARASLERDEIGMNPHRALALTIEHDLFGKPPHTFPDPALERARACSEPVECGAMQ